MLKAKLVSVLGAGVLSLAALPIADGTAPAGTAVAHPVAAATLNPAESASDAARIRPSRNALLTATLGSHLGSASLDVLTLALQATQCATASGDIEPPRTLTVIDYSRPSLEPRLWVFDLERRALLFEELVAHGRNSGEDMATRFSDTMNSHQSSLGLFVTSTTYVGSNGYSLRLDGLEPGFNGRARERAIVMHGAPYVDAKTAAAQGRLGRSWGCPALRAGVARQVIDTIAGGGVIFSYYPDEHWLKTSRFLQGCGGTTPIFS